MKYTVVTGDTMYKIAQRNGIAFANLVEANPEIADPDVIFPGQVIKIPEGKMPGGPGFPGGMMPGMPGGMMPGMPGGMMPGMAVPNEEYRIVKQGAKGKHIEYLQTRLKEMGYYKGDITGRFGHKTKSAVRKFQKDCGMKANGIVDRNFWAGIG